MSLNYTFNDSICVGIGCEEEEPQWNCLAIKIQVVVLCFGSYMEFHKFSLLSRGCRASSSH